MTAQKPRTPRACSPAPCWLSWRKEGWENRDLSEFVRQTARLKLRRFQTEDAAALFRLNSDPEVMRYTGDRPFTDPSAARHFIAHYDHYERNGFGRWAVLDRSSDEFMGFCGLRRQHEDGPVDLAFRFFRRYWASGYATEAARACLETGFEDYQEREIIGRAVRENLPSISVLQKLGMSYQDMEEEDGEFWLVYGVSAQRFLEDIRYR